MRLFYRQLLASVVIIVPVALLGLIAIYYFADRQLREQFQQAAESEARLSALLIGAAFEERLEAMQSIASSPELRRAPRAAMAGILREEMRRMDTELSFLAVGFLDGGVYSVDGGVASIRGLPIHDQVRSGKAEIADFYVGPIARRRNTLFMAPLFAPDGRLRGAVGATLSESEVRADLLKLPISNKGSALLIDRRGAYVSADASLAPEELTAQSLEDVRAGRWVDFQLNDEAFLGYAETIRPGNWTLAVIYREAEIDAQTAPLKRALFVIVGLAAIIAAVAFVASNRVIVRTIESLSETMRRFAGGETSARATIQTETIELAEAARAFNQMADALLDRTRERERYLKELLDRESRLSIAMSSARMGAWRWHVPTNKVEWSPEVAAIFQMALGDFGGDYQAYMNCVHPEDRPRIPEAIQRCFADPEGAYHVRHRIALPGGDVGWIEGFGRLHRDDEGRPETVYGVVLDISDRMLSEARIRESDQLIASIASNIPGGAITRHIRYADGRVRFLYVSPSIEAMIGYGAAEVLENPQLAFIGLHPEDAAQHAEALRRSSESLQTIEEFLRIRHPDGRWRHLHLRSQPKPEDGGAIAWDSVLLDVTERVRTEQLVAEHRGQLAAIFESAGDPILSVNADGALLSFNRQFVQVIRQLYDATPVQGQNILTLPSTEGEREVWRRALQAVNKQRFYLDRVVLNDVYGRSRWYDFSCQAIYGQDRTPIGASFFLKDVTDAVDQERLAERRREQEREAERRRRQERARVLVEGQENERRRVARELHDGVGQMVSATLLGLENARAMISEGQKEDGLALLDRTRQNVLDTIDEIRGIAQLLMPPALQTFGLAAALRLKAQQLHDLSGLDVQLQDYIGDLRFDETIEISVYRVIQEALNNSLRHSGASVCRTRLRFVRNHLRAVVGDDGRGFERSKLRQHRGSGPGFMRERIASLGGRVRIIGGPDRGTVVYVSVPAIAHDGKLSESNSVPGLAPEAGAGAPLKRLETNEAPTPPRL